MSPRAWRTYLIVGLLAACGYLLLPDSAIKGSVLFDLFGASAVVAMVVGVRRNRPPRRRVWLLLAGGQALFVLGDVVYSLYERVLHSTPFPSAADGLYLAGYPLLAVGLLLVVHDRTPGTDLSSLLDAAIVTIGLGTLSWVFLMAPYVHDPSLSPAAVFISLAYPLADVLLLGVAVRLFLSPGARPLPLVLVGLSLASLLVTDTVYAAFNVWGLYESGSALDAGWIASYLLFGAAALHPSMARVCEPAGVPGWRFARWRLALLAATLAAAPLALAAQAARGKPLDVPVLSAAGLALVALGILRLAGVIRGHERSIARETLLHQVGIALVEAGDRQAICEVGARFALSLAAGAERARATVALGSPERLAVAASAGHLAESFEERILPPLPRELRLALAGRRLATVPATLRTEIGVDSDGEVTLAPLVVRDELQGVLALRCDRLPARELRIGLESLAAQVALALESADVAEDLHRRRTEEHFRSLVQHASDVITVVDPDTTIRYQTPSVETALGYPAAELAGRKLAAILHPDDLARALNLLAAATSRTEPQPPAELRVRHRDGSYRHTEVLAANLLGDPSVGGVVLTARDITDRKTLEQELARKAFEDGLTGLANRELLVNRLGHVLSRRHRGMLAVLYLDLDDFKSVNDSLGHAAGDELLVEAAARIRSTLREEDTAARIGGDEFVVLSEDVPSPAGAAELARRLLAALSAPFPMHGREIVCSASAGIAVAREGEIDAEEVLRAADIAMYEAKRAGKGRFTLFEPGMQEAAVKRLELKSELRRALERRELSLEYQPIVGVETGAVLGVEALVRWHHPDRGIVSPAEFVPLAEETGLIRPLGRWVLGEACLQLRAWQMRHPSDPPLWAAVNVSMRQLQAPELVQEVSGAIAAADLDAGSLVLEITESVLAEDVEATIVRLAELRALGVRLAIDDFGAGYSALSYLRRLPVDILKIDRQFIEDLNGNPEQGRLVAEIVRMGRTLDLEVIAEGVESAQQDGRLHDLHCGLGQGFHYAPPLEPEALETLLAAGRRRRAAA